MRFDRPFSPAQLLLWRYDGSSGERPIRSIAHGRLERTLSLQGVHRVTAATAGVIETVLAAPQPDLAGTWSTDIAKRVRLVPGDEQLATVLADALIEDGDVRGEVANLEVALAHELDPAKAGELNARLAALMRKPVALKRMPGGFPHRDLMGARTFTRLTVRNLQLPRVELRALLVNVTGLAVGLLDCEGISRVEMLRYDARILAGRLTAAGAAPKHDGWERAREFTPDELVEVLGEDTAAVLVARAKVRTMTGGPVLPFQEASQWVGRPPTGTASFDLAGKSARFSLPIPDGSACGAARLAELTALFTKLGAIPSRERVQRSVRGGHSLGGG